MESALPSGPSPREEASAEGFSVDGPPIELRKTITHQPPSHDQMTHDGGGEPTPYALPAVRSQTVPGYEIIDVLGKGGMGIVYRARQVALGRTVALKMILNGSLAGSAVLARFRTEATAVAGLHHPNIVQIYEHGEVDGYPYFSLEFVEGGSLAQLLEGARLAIQEAARLTAVLASAMQYAHENNILHRDLKPANILLAPSPTKNGGTGATGVGRPKIADFGLAKRLDDDSGLTVSGTIMGTPSYMAPEQASGEVRRVDRRADIYSLGAMLYEMLTGRPPFKSASVFETIDQVRKKPPISPTALDRRVPRDLETICLKCLRKQPEARYDTCRELAEDLNAFLEGRPISARPVGPVERVVLWSRRNPGAALMLSGIALALLVGTAVSTYFAFRAAAHERIALQRKEESDRRRYVAEYGNAWSKWRAGRMGETRDLLDGLRPERGDPDLRGFEWYYLNRLCHSEFRSTAAHSGEFVLALAPDGRSLATAGQDGRVVLRDGNTGVAIREFDGHVKRATAVAFGRTGKMATGGSDGAVLLHDPATGTTRRLVPPEAGATVIGLTFDPTGDRLAACWTRGVIRLIDATSGATCEFDRMSTGTRDLDFSPDGRSLYAAGGDGEITVWDCNRREIMHRLPGFGVSVRSLKVRGDGLLASGGREGAIKLWRPGDKTPLAILSGHDGAVNDLEFSDDGKRLASSGDDGTVRIWDADLHRELVLLRGHRGPVRRVAFAPGGRVVVSAGTDGTLKFWDSVTPPEKLSLHAHKTTTSAAIFLDDARLATASWDGTIRVWDTESGFERFCLADGLGSVFDLAYSCATDRLAAVCQDGTVRVFDVRGRKEAFRLAELPATVWRRCAFAADGRLLTSGGLDGSVAVWDADSGKLARRLDGLSEQVTSLFFTPDGSRLFAVAADGSRRVWNPRTGVNLDAGEESGQLAAVSPDGKWLVGGTPLVVRDADSGAVRCILRAGEVIPTGLVFSPDGNRIASTGSDRTVRMWDATTGVELLSLDGLNGLGRALAFSPDGLTLAAAGEGGGIVFWHAAPIDEASSVRREAVSLLRFWRVPDKIRADDKVPREVRDLALQLWDKLQEK